jgi:hypothetical protein
MMILLLRLYLMEWNILTKDDIIQDRKDPKGIDLFIDSKDKKDTL